MKLQDQIIQAFTDNYDKKDLDGIRKRYTLGQLMVSFYEGLDLTDPDVQAVKSRSDDEVIDDLDLTNYDYQVWKNMYYNKNGWFNSFS